MDGDNFSVTSKIHLGEGQTEAKKPKCVDKLSSDTHNGLSRVRGGKFPVHR